MSKSLGKQLKEYRLDRQMSQRRMAVAVGLSLGTLVKLEGGDHVSDLTRAKVQKFLNSQAVAA